MPGCADLWEKAIGEPMREMGKAAKEHLVKEVVKALEAGRE
jgi:hypothetical protein